MTRSNFGDGQTIATAKSLHTCTRNGRGGRISPENPAQNLTYAAVPPIAALIITEALFAAACKVALDSDWVVAQPTAQELIGGNIYFHSTQGGPSYFGGEITGFRMIPDDAENAAGRIVFIFKPTIAHKNIRAGRDGWGMEKKIVR